MNEIRIRLDYHNGPIWKDKFDATTGKLCSGVKCVDEDDIIHVLDQVTEQLYSSLFAFDTDGSSCVFKEQAYLTEKKYLLNLIMLLKNRLVEINDGSFNVIDEESGRLMD